MNCEDFNNIIHELADYRPMQATLRDAGVSHVALCADCAAKLTVARAVGNGLVVAAGAESEEAPATVKASLLAAFAELHNETLKPPVVSRLPVSVVERWLGRRPQLWTAAAVAVAAVILVAVILPNWRHVSAPGPIAQSNDVKAGVVEPARGPEAVTAGNDKTVIANDSERLAVNLKSPRAKRRTSRQTTPDASVKGTYETVAQNTGEYLPLTYFADSTAIDSGTIVRVELSRSALASLGLRTNFEGTGNSVKADVVLGDDGVARAIRLVQ
jgi:hypothetical protein